MPVEQYANAVSSTLASSIGAGDLTLTVANASAFPTQGNFRVIVQNPAGDNAEILLVTAVSGNTFTVTRAAEVYNGAQVALAHPGGSTVTLALTAASARAVLGIGQPVTDGTATAVLFVNASGVLAQDVSNLSYDAVNLILSVNQLAVSSFFTTIVNLSSGVNFRPDALSNPYFNISAFLNTTGYTVQFTATTDSSGAGYAFACATPIGGTSTACTAVIQINCPTPGGDAWQVYSPAVALVAKMDNAGVLTAKNINPNASALTYASPTSVDTTLGDVFTVTTVNATGSVTFNATASGTAGRTITIIITNDGTSGKTITFGTNFKPTATLIGTTSKKATVTFRSDGSSWWETSRATGIT